MYFPSGALTKEGCAVMSVLQVGSDVEIQIDLTKVKWVAKNRAGNCTSVSHVLGQGLSPCIYLPLQSVPF